MQSHYVTAFFALADYLTLVLPPGAVPVGGIVKISGIVPPRALCEAVVPPVAVGWEFPFVVADVPVEAAVLLVDVLAVLFVMVVVVAAGGFVVLFLSLPQAKSASARAKIANIERIFFMVIS